MLPLRDENPTRRRALVTIALIVVNVGVFVFIQQLQPDTTTIDAEGVEVVGVPGDLAFDLEYTAIPCEVTTGEPLTLAEVQSATCDPANDTTPQLFPDKHVWVSVLFAMFLHGGWLHLGGNMVFLWVFGNNIEDHLGHVRYLLFYVLAGLAAALAHVAAGPESTVPVLGASGAIAGVMGAYLVWFPDAPVRTLVFFFVILFTEIRAKWLLLAWFVLQFFTGNDSGVAWVAHVGGFVFGVLVGLAGRTAAGRRLLWTPDHRHPPPTGPVSFSGWPDLR